MSYTHFGLPKLTVGVGTHAGFELAIVDVGAVVPLVIHHERVCWDEAVVALRTPS